MDDEEKDTCLKLLQELKVEKKAYSKFEELFASLQKYAASKGLDNEDFDLLGNVIVSTNIGATRLLPLIKCLIPRHKVPEQTFKLVATWYLSFVKTLPITVSIIIVQWIIGLWEYQLIDKKVINIYYSVLFNIMLKKTRLENHMARLIYVLTKPEDVTRRDVLRLLALRREYLKPPKHITALLSLFKTYKPECVPENIPSINVESAWKPIPEVLQTMFRDAKARSEIHQTDSDIKPSLDWNTFKFPKAKDATILLPSVGYFQIGSNIFKEKDTMSIFNIKSMEELGKSHLNIELPCNAISLLANAAGYHLLTFADFNYQSRFSYNLKNTLIRAFVLEDEKFSAEERNKLLDMTIEFSRYMQQGILVVNHFLDEYLYLNTGEYQSKLMALLQWMTSISINDLQEKVLVHVQNIFYESTLSIKCEIIRSLRKLITNLFINQGFKECCQNTPILFFGQGPNDNLENILPILTKISENLIVSGLNIHSYDILLLSEALSFYEEIYMLENRSIIKSFTLAPPAVIYGGFVNRNCSIVSQICKLLLRYRNMCSKFKERKLQNLFKLKIKTLCVYAQDIIVALWYNEPFTNDSDSYFLKNFSQKVLKDLNYCHLNDLLDISNHYAFLPYKYILRKMGLNIETKMHFVYVASCYYPSLSEFLRIFEINDDVTEETGSGT